MGEKVIGWVKYSLVVQIVQMSTGYSFLSRESKVGGGVKEETKVGKVGKDVRYVKISRDLGYHATIGFNTRDYYYYFPPQSYNNLTILHTLTN